MWQERPSAIVMLTNCEEGGRVKCEQYWPDPLDQITVGPFDVLNTHETTFTDYTIRNFLITVSDFSCGQYA